MLQQVLCFLLDHGPLNQVNTIRVLFYRPTLLNINVVLEDCGLDHRIHMGKGLLNLFNLDRFLYKVTRGKLQRRKGLWVLFKSDKYNQPAPSVSKQKVLLSVCISVNNNMYT